MISDLLDINALLNSKRMVLAVADHADDSATNYRIIIDSDSEFGKVLRYLISKEYANV